VEFDAELANAFVRMMSQWENQVTLLESEDQQIVVANNNNNNQAADSTTP
jgi:hypothetical protein